MTENSAPKGVPTSDSGTPLRLGGRIDDTRWFDGVLDEVRVSGARRSEHWIKASYNNQRWPDAKDHPGAGFYVVGAEEHTD